MRASDLYTKLLSAAPDVTEVSVGAEADKTSWIVHFSDGTMWTAGGDPATDDARAAAIRAVVAAFDPGAADSNEILIQQIDTLESAQGRPLREAVLGVPGAQARLQAIDNQITALRSRLVK